MKTAVKGFAYRPVISVVTPVYNTDEVWLRKAIESVRAQIYPHWELCLVNDGSTKPHVRTILNEYAADEPRMKVEHLARNQGIAGASNRGLHLATGDFVALLDHDDELPPEALLEIAKRLNEERGLDLIYTDEDKLDPGRSTRRALLQAGLEPRSASLDELHHASLRVPAQPLQEIGGLRVGLDGSQDSTSSSASANAPSGSPIFPRCSITGGRSRLHRRIQRRQTLRVRGRAPGHRGRGPPPGLEGEGEKLLPGLYSVRYRVRATPIVSIIIPARDRWSLFQQCLRSIEEKTLTLATRSSSSTTRARGPETPMA